jgi:hypothetical protein
LNEQYKRWIGFFNLLVIFFAQYKEVDDGRMILATFTIKKGGDKYLSHGSRTGTTRPKLKGMVLEPVAKALFSTG